MSIVFVLNKIIISNKYLIVQGVTLNFNFYITIEQFKLLVFNACDLSFGFYNSSELVLQRIKLLNAIDSFKKYAQMFYFTH